MVIRPAHADEGERLREITAAAKGVWGYDTARVRAWAGSLDLSPQRLASAHAFVAETDGAVIGWAEILPPEDGICVLEHLWVEPARMRRGAGSALSATPRREPPAWARPPWSGRPSQTRAVSTRGWAAGRCARQPRNGAAT